MNIEPPETLVIIESIVYKSNGFAIVNNLTAKPFSNKITSIPVSLVKQTIILYLTYSIFNFLSLLLLFLKK